MTVEEVEASPWFMVGWLKQTLKQVKTYADRLPDSYEKSQILEIIEQTRKAHNTWKGTVKW